jgi:hypothetical protein
MADERSVRWSSRLRASLVTRLERYGERQPLVIRLIERLERKAPIPGCVPLGFVICSVCVGYLLAASLNVGVHGLESTAQLDQSNTYPDANGFFLIAIGMLMVGMFVTGLGIGPDAFRAPAFRRRMATFAGAVVVTAGLGVTALALIL